MKSYLKTAEIDVDGIGKLTIHELSAKTQLEMLEMQSANLHVAAFVCKSCVVEWVAETVDDIELSMGVNALQKIAGAVYDLSGIPRAKNSEPAPSDGSSSV